MASELVPVEQVDRDAAGDLAEQQQGWYSIGGNDIAAIRHGFWDKCNDDLGVIVQAFARHRLAALEAQASRIAELEAHLREHNTFIVSRIQDGRDMGATVWRLALEDILRENRALLGDREG